MEFERREIPNSHADEKGSREKGTFKDTGDGRLQGEEKKGEHQQAIGLTMSATKKMGGLVEGRGSQKRIAHEGKSGLHSLHCRDCR